MISPYHGNFAPFVLILIIPLTFYFFATKKPWRAAMLVAFLGTMCWPNGVFIRLPSTPVLTKDNVPYLAMMAALLIFHPKILFKAKPGTGPEFLMILSVLASLMTWKTNPDVLAYGSWITTVLPALTFVDGMSMGLDHVFRLFFPFFVGRALFQNSQQLRELIRFLALCALLYTFPILIELRMSPIVHNWIYGYMASNDFLAVLRWGGYRPMVCMMNGLALSLLMLEFTILAAALTRAKIRITKRAKNKTVLIFMCVMVLLCKSTGAIIYGVVLIPAVLKAKVKTQLKIAATLAFLAISYPTMKANGFIPVDAILDFASAISEERSGSLRFRFKNEELLADKAAERPLFGWGSYGRNAIYHEEIGKEMSVADGYWIILIGVRGMVGFLLSFALALYPVFVARRRIPKIADKRDQILLSALALVVAIGIFDMIPNGLFSNYTYFLSGALYGLVTNMTKKRRQKPASG